MDIDKEFIEFTPEKLDEYLLKTYRVRLCVFAISLARCLRFGELYFPKQDYLDLRKKIHNLKKKANTLEKEIRKIFGYNPQILSKNLYNHEDNLDLYLADIEVRHLDKKRGASIKTRNEIALIWASYFQEVCGKINWDLLANLFDWFWERLKDYKCYIELDPGPFGSDPEYLKNQYYKHKKAGSKIILDKDFRDSVMGRFQWDTQYFNKHIKTDNARSQLGLRRINYFSSERFYNLSSALFLEYLSYKIENKPGKYEREIPIWSRSALESLYENLFSKLLIEHDSDVGILLPLVIFPDYTFLS